MGSAPNDVKGSNALQYELDKMNWEHILHNNQNWRQKAGRLKDEGAFRVPTDRNTWERIAAPKFAGKVLQVDGLKGSHVESGDKSYPVKTVLAVPAGSANVDLDDAGPGQGRKAKQTEVLEDYAKDLHKLIPSERLDITNSSEHLARYAWLGRHNGYIWSCPSWQGRIFYENIPITFQT